ncbi:Diphthine-ammonia ligase [Exophiala dermatitidis]|uniref:Diphthine--ammonia ligase n=2 Tax=Exophiala dermatitidis TaxID=5970 RepID=H6BM44_EXODN|nr:uncharacterized protein HMPREF1120_00203 [Exophiala dermatitidis NIH/UT8656]EHY51980.1 hypothetical protein HMPREF1120_00203 [Exophiala dermatitidis NIH/UT8656]KAJ4514652.1 hypothetical protein HRR75_004016 [Exophiala dermatitidis]KAJ4545998.1 hypothetical protein HRR78_005837 [Exophiala dermatitidis]
MAAETLNVIALISGGKDSLYSILHCLDNGHKVVALANLYPRPRSPTERGANDTSPEDTEGEDEDLNSFMYQTVGYSIIPLYAECLGLPLYRRQITGSAVQTGRYYDASEIDLATADRNGLDPLDETEDLVPLLQEVMKAHPEANAVCSGAILSTYQRTRVESIAVRLGLTPLAYLWQYPALPPPAERMDSLTGLLDDMAAAGCDARIVKIASGGIKESLLWSNVADPRTRARLVAGLRPFFPDHEFELRGAVLGEGGEYESLAVNGPNRLWKKRIVVAEEKSSTVVGDGGVCYIRLRDARTVQNESISTEQDKGPVRVPGVLDPQFDTVLTRLQGLKPLPLNSTWSVTDGHTSKHDLEAFVSASFPLGQTLTGSCLTISNITAPGASTPTEQMKGICNMVDNLLGSSAHSLRLPWTPNSSDIVFATLLLRDMAQFGPVNSIYATLFRAGKPNPPARVTIACDLPAGIDVSLNLVLDLRPRHTRRGLHVQSRSYWAPANIGPYSQAICVAMETRANPDSNVHDAGLVELVHMAGQIPLVPQTMTVSDKSFVEQAVLSLQHLWRVAQERGVDIWPWGIAFLKKDSAIASHAVVASKVWQEANLIGTRPVSESSTEGDSDNDDEDGPDAWDRQFNRSSLHDKKIPATNVGGHLHILPNHKVFKSTSIGCKFVRPFIAAEVASLPRDAPIEWWSLGLANLPQLPSSVPRISASGQHRGWGSVSIVTVLPGEHQDQEKERETESIDRNTEHLVTVLMYMPNSSQESNTLDTETIERDITDMLSERYADTTPPSYQAVHGTAFISAEFQSARCKLNKHSLFSSLAVVPCKSVYGSSGLEMTIVDGHKHTEVEQRSESTKTLNPATDGSTSLSGGQLQEEGVSLATSTTSSDAVLSETCKPLAAALTMRITIADPSSSSDFTRVLSSAA